jgi:hypothetical protein
MPPGPSRAVEIRTSDAPLCGETANVATALESMSDSVSTRPGSGSVTFIRYARVRPPAVILSRITVSAPTQADST